MKYIINLLKVLGSLLAICLGIGSIVSKVEKKKGWTEEHKPYGLYERCVKRSLDFGLSLFAVVLLWPVILTTALLVKVRLGSPILFKQKRPGLGGKVFEIKKFRTMRTGKGTDEERLTDFGKRLRTMSIDELPELENIIRGDMSIIGPRPLLVEYLELYNEEQKHRHDVRPGLTGLAQISGRNELSWNEKFENDVKYAEHITFLGDLRILFDTIKIVFKKEGITSRTSATMEYFTGSEEK